METIDDNQKLYSYDEENGLELEDVPPQEILEDQEVTRGKDHILIDTVALYRLYYAKN